MLSKEEIEKFIQEMTEVRPEKLNKEALKLYSKIMEILDKNEQLEVDKQKLIKKLEEDIKNNNFKEMQCLEDKGRYYFAKEILRILKGESNE